LRRVKRLERSGYIEGYRAALRRDRIGLGFSVFLGVKIEGHANERALQFEKAIVAMPEIVACHLVSGEADYFLEVVVPELADYQRFLVDKLLNLPSCARYAAILQSRPSRQAHHCPSSTSNRRNRKNFRRKRSWTPGTPQPTKLDRPEHGSMPPFPRRPQ
jgi:DNA-binding Lrp family transcriptional regulator